MRKNKCVPLNLCGGKLYSDVGNDLSGYKELSFLVSGEGETVFSDDLGNEIRLSWTEKTHTVKENVKNVALKVYHIEKAKLI